MTNLYFHTFQQSRVILHRARMEGHVPTPGLPNTHVLACPGIQGQIVKVVRLRILVHLFVQRLFDRSHFNIDRVGYDRTIYEIHEQLKIFEVNLRPFLKSHFKV